MHHKTPLKVLFCGILLTMIAATVWASLRQPIQNWGGLTTGPDRYWTIATTLDAYCGFLTFYAWVFYKESRWLRRVGWFLAIMLLGNIAMSVYVLRQLMREKVNQPSSDLLLARNP
jgi:Protein of unknown function (DUF1475)